MPCTMAWPYVQSAEQLDQVPGSWESGTARGSGLGGHSVYRGDFL